jgi:hypothetical protein
MNTGTLIAIAVIVAMGTVMGLAVIPSLSTSANAQVAHLCLNGNNKVHPGHGHFCPPGLVR